MKSRCLGIHSPYCNLEYVKSMIGVFSKIVNMESTKIRDEVNREGIAVDIFACGAESKHVCPGRALIPVQVI
jgi:hypothetical protein